MRADAYAQTFGRCAKHADAERVSDLTPEVKTIRLTIDVSEQDAALLWADETWYGKSPEPISEIIAAAVHSRAVRYLLAFPTCDTEATIALFRKAQEVR